MQKEKEAAPLLKSEQEIRCKELQLAELEQEKLAQSIDRLVSQIRQEKNEVTSSSFFLFLQF